MLNRCIKEACSLCENMHTFKDILGKEIHLHFSAQRFKHVLPVQQCETVCHQKVGGR